MLPSKFAPSELAAHSRLVEPSELHSTVNILLASNPDPLPSSYGSSNKTDSNVVVGAGVVVVVESVDVVTVVVVVVVISWMQLAALCDCS